MAEAQARLSQDLKDALRAGQKVRLGALRLLAASLKNREVELRRELSDEEFLEVVAREVKRRREATEAYEGAGRTELAEKEREEQAVLEAYLPLELGEEELAGRAFRRPPPEHPNGENRPTNGDGHLE